MAGAFRGSLVLRLAGQSRQFSVSSFRFAAKPAAKPAAAAASEEAVPQQAKPKVTFDENGAVMSSTEPMKYAKRRPKLAIEPVDRSLSKFIHGNLNYVVIETKRTSNMTRAGKRASMSSLVVVGNGNGALGYAFGRAAEPLESITKGILRAARSLIPVRRLDNHTIFEKSMVKVKSTRLFVRPKTPGNGLVCHKFIAAMCKLAGIQDLGADVIGPTNPLSIVRAFFHILENQRTAQERALEQKKSILEYRHLDTTPRVVLQYTPTPEEKKIKEATRSTLSWLRAFPREPTFSNFLIVRDLLASSTPTTASGDQADSAPANTSATSTPATGIDAKADPTPTPKPTPTPTPTIANASDVNESASPKDALRDLKEWLKMMPAEVRLEDTALAGCTPPPNVVVV